MEIDLSKVPKNVYRNDKILFSESAGRFIVTINPEYQERFEEMLGGHEYGQVGYVTEGDRFVIRGIGGNEVVNRGIGELKAAYKKTFGDLT